MFLVRYRSRFFELLHICLVMSTKFPIYLGASFAKKLCRLALTAPPSGAMLAITLVHNMIQKHPALLPLIHRTKSVTNEDAAGEDPFDEEAQDPKHTKALDSSLWELQALESHYAPAVRTLVSSFHTLFSELKVRKFNVEDYVDESYESIFENELTAKAKHVALAFEKPDTLWGAGGTVAGAWAV